MGSRLEAKIEKCFESGDLYEAHQIYRTLFYRLSAQKKFSELLALLLDGCSRLAKAGELVSAVDLAELYADTLNTGAVKVTEEILNSIQKIFSELPAHLPSDSEVAPGEDRRLKFVGKVVSWSQRGAPTQRERRRGLAALHARLAEVHRAEGNLEASRRHFLLSDHPEELANVLVDMQTKEGYWSEVDLFVAIVVFQLICLRRARMANDLLFAYCRKHPAISTDVLPFELPLLNFCALLLQSITKTRSLRQFSLLVEKYQPELTRAPSFKGYLDKIGQMYFGMPPATRASPGGLLGNLFKGLFGDDSKKDESSSEDEFLEGSPEAMEEDGYDTAPEDEAVRTPRQTQNSSVPAAATGMQTNLDDLD